MDDVRAPKVVILTHDGRALPEITIYKKTAGPGRQPTGLRCLIKTDAVLGRPYPPCPGRTGIGRQGPGVRTGRLGTLVSETTQDSRISQTNNCSSHCEYQHNKLKGLVGAVQRSLR